MKPIKIRKEFTYFGFLILVVGSLWLFDYALSLFSKSSDVAITAGLCILFGLLLLWIRVGKVVYKEGQLFYQQVVRKNEDTKKEG